jgi:O-acetylhomoserine (thiol)-lyase
MFARINCSLHGPSLTRYRRIKSIFEDGINGGMEAGKTFYDSLQLITRLVNIGDAKSLACHPASTTHRQMTPDQQRNAGVLPETIRLSIGIEHFADIIEDIDQALAKACPSERRLEAAE